jgi:aryl-alcohol dehydrogenase-like predicted oxidoreductase
MQMIELGRTGERVSALALGAMQMGNATGEEDSVRILDRFREIGGTHIDTADCYEWWARPGGRGGESEELLGRWMRSRSARDEIFLATKGSGLPHYSPDLWAADGTPNWDLARRTFSGAGAGNLRRALEGSLRRLGTDHVDLYYVHVDDPSTPLEETLPALASFVREGKVRHLGWSNVSTSRLSDIRAACAANGWPLPVAIQQQHSYLRPVPPTGNTSIVDDAQLDYLRAHDDQTLVAYSPILRGIYDSAAKRDGHPLMEEYLGPDTDARLDALAAVADEAGVTPNQLVVAWLLHQDSPRVIPLVGPRTPEQFEATLPALDVKLTAEQLARLG